MEYQVNRINFKDAGKIKKHLIKEVLKSDKLCLLSFPNMGGKAVSGNTLGLG
jgi:hypothetical protein